jgi:hypothetical protein
MTVHTDAGAYDVTELREKYYSGRSSKLIAASLAICLLGAGALGWERGKEVYQEQRRRFIQRLIAEELGRIGADDAGLTDKQLRLRLAQERDKNLELTERIVAIAQAVEIDQ